MMNKRSKNKKKIAFFLILVGLVLGLLGVLVDAKKDFTHPASSIIDYLIAYGLVNVGLAILDSLRSAES